MSLTGVCSMQHQGQPRQSAGQLLADTERSGFLSGLVGGFGPRMRHPSSLPSQPLAAPAGLQLPQLPQMRPLPPLPHVPTIAEFQRTISGSRLTSMTSPVEIPRLEVLPLVGVGPPQVCSLLPAVLQPPLASQGLSHTAFIIMASSG